MGIGGWTSGEPRTRTPVPERERGDTMTEQELVDKPSVREIIEAAAGEPPDVILGRVLLSYPISEAAVEIQAYEAWSRERVEKAESDVARLQKQLAAVREQRALLEEQGARMERVWASRAFLSREEIAECLEACVRD